MATFHLAITMAGAVSAGAYTAGVMDYLLETLDNWYEMKANAKIFFEKQPELKGKTWAELDKMNIPDKEILHNAKKFNALPDHDIKIEILSGASAGGMTAAITSFVLHQKNKHSIKLRSSAETKAHNRLYNAWVNLSGQDDMLPELLSDSDIISAQEVDKSATFPVSLFNSKFVRDISERALKINNPANMQLSPYVAEDFNLFVTLTNLSGFFKSIRFNGSNANYLGDFITNDHRDLMMFNFGKIKQPGTINVNFTVDKKKEKEYKQMLRNTVLLRNAAVSTGAFPIGLEYGFINREAEYINDNFLLRQIYGLEEKNPDNLKLVLDENSGNLILQPKNINNSKLIKTFDYSSVFIDGGLINNEPFDLTKMLLFEKLRQPIINAFAAQKPPTTVEKALKQIEDINQRANVTLRAERFNRTILMIDPFPSEKKDKPKISPNADPQPNSYPYSFIGGIVQLISSIRNQLLVKPDLLEKGFNEDDFECFLIAPRRRIYKIDKTTGKPQTEDGCFQPEVEKDVEGNILIGADGQPIPKAYDGSAAIACGSLWGFGGFLDRNFREHDFFLGRYNCKSFLRHHFRISDDRIPNSVFKDAYLGEAANIFRITEKNIDDDGQVTKETFMPLIPEISVIDKLLAEKNTIAELQERKDIDTLYGELNYPVYNQTQFRKHRRKLKKRLFKVIFSSFNLFLSPFFLTILKPFIWLIFTFIFRTVAFRGIYDFVEQDLTDWQLIRKKSGT